MKSFSTQIYITLILSTLIDCFIFFNQSERSKTAYSKILMKIASQDRANKYTLKIKLFDGCLEDAKAQLQLKTSKTS